MHKDNEEVVNYLLDSYNEVTQQEEKDYYLGELDRFKEETKNFTEPLAYIRVESTTKPSEQGCKHGSLEIMKVSEGGKIEPLKQMIPQQEDTEDVFKPKNEYNELSPDDDIELLNELGFESLDYSEEEQDDYRMMDDNGEFKSF